MKKRTVEEKHQIIDEACELIKNAASMLKKGKKMLHLCGIDICDSFCFEDVQEWKTSGSNIQIFKGINKLESITGVDGCHPIDIIGDKPDKSRKVLKYNGVVFLQVGRVSPFKYSYR